MNFGDLIFQFFNGFSQMGEKLYQFLTVKFGDFDLSWLQEKIINMLGISDISVFGLISSTALIGLLIYSIVK